jgi:hypothetical protein
LLTHTLSVETMEEQLDDKWMKIRCNDTSAVQMVKVKFSSQVVRNGMEYSLYFVSYHVVLLFQNNQQFLHTHSFMFFIDIHV